MRVFVGSQWPERPVQACLLQHDSWDDWFRFETTKILYFRSAEGQVIRIGSLKIGEKDMQSDQRTANIPTDFSELPGRFFSLGQDASYYETLNELGDAIRDDILRTLNDVAADLGRFDANLGEAVMGRSLLRFVPPATVRGQFHRISKGGARLSPFAFSYTAPKRRGNAHPPVELTFSVAPESMPPTNVHVLIGRNGVGKTYLLNQMTRAVVQDHDETADCGEFLLLPTHGAEAAVDQFANVVSVTFSAFDPFLPLRERRDRSEGIRYSYIGLKRPTTSTDAKRTAPALPKSPGMLATEFSRSMLACRQGARRSRWERALQMLESDPVFRDVGIAELADTTEDDEELRRQANNYFNRLSSGHKIVLLSITRLVEEVEERTLVLLDEPEAHLHPPLLSAFVRSLSDLLINRNGVAVVATHSPVILQEVPRSCVWMVRRSGMKVDSERPSLETFGENVGVLTREVFGLEVTDSGFNRMLRESLRRASTFEDALLLFDGQLGGEAQAILRAYFANRGEQST